ncbi:hypothetical protein jhhlp_006940 [Lomentospora prolificans]|uniref:BZIP domain-containing protein n=1 Tax=Lomentospora prolificans TaxID=41688 RepID=A0A2N3N373_9PEZI|nr:hypothetical protein jhhlp_006940 [Lomentospora prolificans]
MSTYGGRRGPNVSQYLRHLNTIPTESTNDDSFIDDDLSLFTNTRFFDFESGQTTDFQAPSVKPENEQISSSSEPLNTTSPVTDLAGLDFISDFNFPDFAPYQSSTLNPGFPDALPMQSLPPPTQVFSNNIAQQQQQQQSGAFVQSQPRAGDKRKSEPLDDSNQLSFEDASRLAAEEDKRRRNTAASARFRIKKKQREQALERTAKEMSEKVTVLEGRIQQLETENKWLKNMILEKNGGSEQISSLLDKGLSSKDKAETAKSAEAVKSEL